MASSKVPIYTALIANFLIAVTKFIAASFSGSSAMISEGIHSLVDSGNEILLLIGIRRSKKPADAKRPFGYGKELYFWSFIVSVLIFAIGGGISFYEGITHLQHPTAVKDPFWNYIVLCVAILFDGISFVVALKEFNKQRGATAFWHAVKSSKDPTGFVVLFEDAADVLGLFVAFLGIYLGRHYNNPVYDAIASIVIGIILTAISVVLATESRSLLMGESLHQKILDKIVALSVSESGIHSVKTPLSMYLSPEEVVLVLPVTFKSDLSQQEVYTTIQKLKTNIQQKFPIVKQLVIEINGMELQP